MHRLYPSDWYVWTTLILGGIALVCYLKNAWDIHKHQRKKKERKTQWKKESR